MLGRMSTSSKSSTSDRLLGLTIIAGVMLLLTALPVGIGFCLLDHHKFHAEWRWAIMSGVVMTAATAVVGGILHCTGEFLVKRSRKMEEKRGAV